MNETLLQTIKERRSTKNFLSTPVEVALIEKIVEAGTYAASGKGKQAAIIIQITNPAIRNQLSKLNSMVLGMDGSFDPFYGAPVVLAVLADRSIPTYLYDGSLVMGNMMLAAEALDVGSCWIHRAKEVFELPEGKAILNSLGIQGDYEGIGHCVLGYPATKVTKIAPRKPNYIYKID